MVRQQTMNWRYLKMKVLNYFHNFFLANPFPWKKKIVTALWLGWTRYRLYLRFIWEQLNILSKSSLQSKCSILVNILTIQYLQKVKVDMRINVSNYRWWANPTNHHLSSVVDLLISTKFQYRTSSTKKRVKRFRICIC